MTRGKHDIDEECDLDINTIAVNCRRLTAIAYLGRGSICIGKTAGAEDIWYWLVWLVNDGGWWWVVVSGVIGWMIGSRLGLDGIIVVINGEFYKNEIKR